MKVIVLLLILVIFLVPLLTILCNNINLSISNKKILKFILLFLIMLILFLFCLDLLFFKHAIYMDYIKYNRNWSYFFVALTLFYPSLYLSIKIHKKVFVYFSINQFLLYLFKNKYNSWFEMLILKKYNIRSKLHMLYFFFYVLLPVLYNISLFFAITNILDFRVILCFIPLIIFSYIFQILEFISIDLLNTMLKNVNEKLIIKLDIENQNIMFELTSKSSTRPINIFNYAKKLVNLQNKWTKIFSIIYWYEQLYKNSFNFINYVNLITLFQVIIILLLFIRFTLF